MTVLSDSDIAQAVHYGDLVIDPYRPENLQPGSYDITLGNEWEVPVEAPMEDKPISLDEGLPDRCKREFEADTIVLGSMYGDNETSTSDPVHDPFALGCVEEYIAIPPGLTAEVKGRSSIGRIGVIPHTAGWGDPGWKGILTLELANLSPNPIKLDAGRRIAQVVFKRTTSESSVPYGEKDDQKYQGQTGVTESRIEEDHNGY